MSEEILINSMPMEYRVAVVEQGVLQELHIERPKRSIVGNIYLARVLRILPGMQAAFIDIGQPRAAFLQPSQSVADPSSDSNPEPIPSDNQTAPAGTRPSIHQFHEGQSLLVQVSKDALGNKGARVTTHLSIPSRYLVFTPDNAHIGVSLRIEQESERSRLKALLQSCLQRCPAPCVNGGFIIRTAAERVTDEQFFLEDLAYLDRLWQDINDRVHTQNAPTCVYQDLPLIKRAIRDLTLGKTDRVRVDQRHTYEQLKSFCEQYVPFARTKLQLYEGHYSLFDVHGIEDQIKQAFNAKVPLKSGGYISIEQTEALTTIDVNTGAFVGRQNLQETILHTNMEAALMALRQLRLRNIGGIVVIDFIDMLQSKDQQALLELIVKTKEKDSAKIRVSGFSGLGLVELSRKRSRESLEQLLSEPCPYCHGHGRVKTVETIGFEILRALYRLLMQAKSSKTLTPIKVNAQLEVIKWLMSHAQQDIAELEVSLGRNIRWVEMQYHSQDSKLQQRNLREHYRIEN